MLPRHVKYLDTTFSEIFKKISPVFLDPYFFIHKFSMLDDKVTKKVGFFYRLILSDNFTQVEVQGDVFMKNM